MTSPLSRRDLARTVFLAVVTVGVWLVGKALWHEGSWLAPPEYDIDALETLARIKLIGEQGLSFFVDKTIPRLGAPFGADWSSYPMPDMLVLWLLGKFAKFVGLIAVGHLALLLANLVNVLTFYFCSRTLGHRPQFAACAAMLFGFSHYNVSRGVSHYSFTLSFTVPAILLVVWLIGSSRVLLHKWRWRLFCLATAAITGMGSPYFGLMLVTLLAMALAYQALTTRRKANLLVGSACLVIWGIVTGACNYAAIQALFATGSKVLVRDYAGTELYGMRPIEWFVPPAYHRLPGAAQFTEHYGRLTLFEGEHSSSYLGVIGIVGVAVTLIAFLRTLLQGRAGFRPAYALTIGLIIAFGMVGGFNSALALTVTSVFRAGNRYAIFILAIGLFALAGWASVRWRNLSQSTGNAIAVVLILAGLWDAMRPIPSEGELAFRARAPEVDWRLGNHLEEALSPGALVFQLPAVPFLEQRPIVGMTDYEHFRPFFFTKTLRFSYGILANQDAIVWQRRVARMAAPEMRAELEAVGFSAIYVCRSAYIDGAKAMRRTFEEAGMPVIFDAGPHIVFRLQPSASPQLPALTGPNRQEPWDGVSSEARKLGVFEGAGWFHAESGGKSVWRWGGKRATCVLWNPTGALCKARVRCHVMDLRSNELSIRLAGGRELWRGKLRAAGVPCEFELELNAGETELEWNYDGTPTRASPSDRRMLGFRVNDMVLEER